MSSEQNPNQKTSAEITQIQLDTLMGIFEDYKGNLAEGDYLRGMNALCSLHKIKTKQALLTGDTWMTHADVCNNDDVFDDVSDIAEELAFELCGASIIDDDRIVASGQETNLLSNLVNYRPTEGTAGYGVSPHILHHAQQFIYCRMFNDMFEELEMARPAVCECGWRGTQGNWDRHTNNVRHRRWVDRKTVVKE